MENKVILDKKKASEGSVVNRALSSLHGGSHEIMLTVPLKGTVVNPALPSLYGGSQLKLCLQFL